MILVSSLRMRFTGGSFVCDRTETRRRHARNSLVDTALHSRRTDINRLPSIETHGRDVASSSCGHDSVRFRVRFFGTDDGRNGIRV